MAKQGVAYRSLVYFLCVSLLLLMSGFPKMIAEAKEMTRPIGEMVSTGDVKYETSANAWKRVETANFPVFQGVKIKTEQGASSIALANNSQVEVGQNSVLSFIEGDRLHLLQGSIDFRIPAAADTSIRVASLSIIKSRSLQATKNSSVATVRNEGIIGSLTLHPNGSVTIKSDEGTLSIVNQERIVLATVSSKESLTIPSTVASGKDNVMVAQAGPGPAAAGGGATVAGLSVWALGGIGVLGASMAGLAIGARTGTPSGRAPVCP